MDRAVRKALRARARALLFALGALAVACGLDERRSGVPPEAQAVIDRVTEDIAAGRDEKLYREAAEEWRRAATPDESRAAIARVRERLGRIEGRTLYGGTERDGPGGELPGHTLVVRYQTKFERGIGMETFTLVERDGRWLLARYAVNSDALR